MSSHEKPLFGVFVIFFAVAAFSFRAPTAFSGEAQSSATLGSISAPAPTSSGARLIDPKTGEDISYDPNLPREELLRRYKRRLELSFDQIREQEARQVRSNTAASPPARRRGTIITPQPQPPANVMALSAGNALPITLGMQFGVLTDPTTGRNLDYDPRNSTPEKLWRHKRRFEILQAHWVNRRKAFVPDEREATSVAATLERPASSKPTISSSTLPMPVQIISPDGEDLSYDPNLPREDQVRRHKRRLQLLFEATQLGDGGQPYSVPTPKPAHGAFGDLDDGQRACFENLQRIHTALVKYRVENAAMPDWLSDLVPKYLDAESLICPDDKKKPDSCLPDPRLACSYAYLLPPWFVEPSTSTIQTPFRILNFVQWDLSGPVVPIVQCDHHSPTHNVGWNGLLYARTEPLSENGAQSKLVEFSSIKPLHPLLFDNFTSGLALQWRIVEPSGHSLTSRPGALSVTVSDRTSTSSGLTPKSLLVLDHPITADRNFQITACLTLDRSAAGLEAGLICCADNSNSLEWVYKACSNGPSLILLMKSDKDDPTSASHELRGPADKAWLRISRQGNLYLFSQSTDGRSFNVLDERTWGGMPLINIGLVAAYQPDGRRPGGKVRQATAAFEFFALEPLE